MIAHGDPKHRGRSGDSVSLTFEIGRVAVAIVHNDHIERWMLSKPSTGTTTGTIHLRGPEGSLKGLPQEGHVVVHVRRAEDAPVQLARLHIDYWNARHDATGTVIEIQGRGPLGALVDRPFSETFAGELEDFVRELTSAETSVSAEGMAGRPVDLYAESPSAYAALRILGVSLNFIIQESDDGERVVMSSLEAASREVLARPLVTLTGKDVQHAEVKRGAPIRRRTH